MACTLSSRNVPTPWLPCTVSLPRRHFSLSPVFRFSVVLSGQPHSKVETIVKNSKGKGTVPGGKRQEMLVIHVLVENTVAMLDNGGGSETASTSKDFHHVTSKTEWFWSRVEDVDADPFSVLYGHIEHSEMHLNLYTQKTELVNLKKSSIPSFFRQLLNEARFTNRTGIVLKWKKKNMQVT